MFQLPALSVANYHGVCDVILYLFMVNDVYCGIVGAPVDWPSQEDGAKTVNATTPGTVVQICCQCFTSPSSSKTI